MEQLWQRKAKTITHLELLSFFSHLSFSEAAEQLVQLVNERVIQPIQASGTVYQDARLYQKYKILPRVNRAFQQRLLAERQTLHRAICLDYYYEHEQQWHEDEPIVRQIDQFLQQHGIPGAAVLATELSVMLGQPEKWLSEGNGKVVLERLGLYEQFNLVPFRTPLVFALHPALVHERRQRHLIVENKTTFEALLPVIQETAFATLIFGAGWAIVKAIEQFRWQYPVEAEHEFMYFGDIDREGAAIAYELQVPLAVPFYEACLQKKPLRRVNQQKPAREAVAALAEQCRAPQLITVLAGDDYYPQELLTTEELQAIWRAMK